MDPTVGLPRLELPKRPPCRSQSRDRYGSETVDLLLPRESGLGYPCRTGSPCLFPDTGTTPLTSPDESSVGPRPPPPVGVLSLCLHGLFRRRCRRTLSPKPSPSTILLSTGWDTTLPTTFTSDPGSSDYLHTEWYRPHRDETDVVPYPSRSPGDLARADPVPHPGFKDGEIPGSRMSTSPLDPRYGGRRKLRSGHHRSDGE